VEVVEVEEEIPTTTTITKIPTIHHHEKNENENDVPATVAKEAVTTVTTPAITIDPIAKME